MTKPLAKFTWFAEDAAQYLSSPAILRLNFFERGIWQTLRCLAWCHMDQPGFFILKNTTLSLHRLHLLTTSYNFGRSTPKVAIRRAIGHIVDEGLLTKQSDGTWIAPDVCKSHEESIVRSKRMSKSGHHSGGNSAGQNAGQGGGVQYVPTVHTIVKSSDDGFKKPKPPSDFPTEADRKESLRLLKVTAEKLGSKSK